MIVTTAPPGSRLVTQSDHARLAADLLRLFRLPELLEHPRARAPAAGGRRTRQRLVGGRRGAAPRRRAGVGGRLSRRCGRPPARDLAPRRRALRRREPLPGCPPGHSLPPAALALGGGSCLGELSLPDPRTTPGAAGDGRREPRLPGGRRPLAGARGSSLAGGLHRRGRLGRSRSRGASRSPPERVAPPPILRRRIDRGRAAAVSSSPGYGVRTLLSLPRPGAVRVRCVSRGGARRLPLAANPGARFAPFDRRSGPVSAGRAVGVGLEQSAPRAPPGLDGELPASLHLSGCPGSSTPARPRPSVRREPRCARDRG